MIDGGGGDVGGDACVATTKNALPNRHRLFKNLRIGLDVF